MISKRKSASIFIVMAATAGLPAAGLCANLDAGSILREQKQVQQPLPERLPRQEEKGLRQTGRDSSAKIMVKGFRFSGIKDVATDEELQAVVAQAVGKEQSMAELQGVAESVTNYLRGKGFLLAGAYLPKQEIVDGIVEIAVTAGRIEGAAKIRIKAPSRVREQLLREIAAEGVRDGDVADNGNLERSIMLINDLPGITARATLEKGAAPGTTRVVIDAEEEPLLSGSVSVDNFGNSYTGSWRGTGQANASDALGIGDLLNVSLTGAENLLQGRVGYSLPVGTNGLRANLSYTGLYYELGKEMASLNANGRADTIGTGLSLPFLRSRDFNIWGSMSYEYRMLTDESNGVKTRDRKVGSATVDVSASKFDGLNGGGMTSVRLALGAGSVDLSGSADDEANDASTAKTSGTFIKFNYTIARLQRLADSLTLYASLNGQFANTNLDSSEKFILGGNGGVRAYPGGEGNGDAGHIITTEVRYDVPVKSTVGTLQLVSFFDAGYITLHTDQWDHSVTTATGRNDYWITGAGLGFNLARTGIYSLRTSWAHTIGDNPGRTTYGKNADNTGDENRFWLSGTLYF